MGRKADPFKNDLKFVYNNFRTSNPVLPFLIGIYAPFTPDGHLSTELFNAVVMLARFVAFTYLQLILYKYQLHTVKILS